MDQIFKCTNYYEIQMTLTHIFLLLLKSDVTTLVIHWIHFQKKSYHGIKHIDPKFYF